MAQGERKPGTKQRILRAACDLLERGGMDAVSIRRVARKVGITPMGIYNHFSNLEALMLAVYESGVTKLARHLWRDIVRTPSAADKLRALVHAYITFGVENPHYYSLIFGTQFIQKYLWDQPPRSRVMENFWVPFTEIIEACQDSGFIDPKTNPQEIATHLWASMHGYVSFFLIGRLQQLWQMDERMILEKMERQLLPFKK